MSADATENTARETLVIDGYTLKMTSIACPEQYDVYNSNKVLVGYLRLRHGWFRADCPDCGGNTVYEAYTRGDGCFDDDERLPQLTAAIRAIDQYWRTSQYWKNISGNETEEQPAKIVNKTCGKKAKCCVNNSEKYPAGIKQSYENIVPGYCHPAAYSGDVLTQLKNWRSRHLAHTGDLMDMAIAEITRLRRLMFKYAARVSRASAEIAELKANKPEPPAFSVDPLPGA